MALHAAERILVPNRPPSACVETWQSIHEQTMEQINGTSRCPWDLQWYLGRSQVGQLLQMLVYTTGDKVQHPQKISPQVSARSPPPAARDYIREGGGRWGTGINKHGSDRWGLSGWG